MFSEVPTWLPDVHEITEPSTAARSFVELAAPSLPEVGDRGVLARQHAPAVVPTAQPLQRRLGLLLVLELKVYIAHHVVAQILADLDILQSAELLQLLIDLFIEIIEL
jgi:hypothetical protein